MRRLVVVPDRVPGAVPIRDVPLRRGLNVVRVADRPAGDDRVIAHSVGKTLFTRLLRYCLGESHFAPADRTAVIRDVFPSAFVLAEIRVDGSGWVVARPLRDGRVNESFAARADEWQGGLVPAAELLPFADFFAAVQEAAFAGLPGMMLPATQREPRWLDVLAWVARDAGCKYQHPHEWRDPHARSGTGRLDLTDASLLTSWLLGVHDAEDISEQEQRQRWAGERDQAQGAADVARRRANALEPMLADRLRVDVGDGVFGDLARQAIDDRRSALEADRSAAASNGQLGSLQDAMTSAAAALGLAEGDLLRIGGLRDEAVADIRGLGQANAASYYAKYDKVTCPLDRCECRLHPANRVTVPDADRLARIAERQADYVRHVECVNELTAALPRMKDEVTKATKAFSQGRDELLGPIDKALGRLDQVEEEYKRLVGERQKAAKFEATIERLEGLIRESQERQRVARVDRDRRVGELSRLYALTLKGVIGPEVGGVLARDARGLHPSPGESAAPGGATLGSLAQVIAFDLTALAAAASGICRLPGLLIHDSPESIVMESALHARLLGHVLNLEAAYGDRPIGFQYIVTTTAPPPSEVAGGGFDVLSLDARAAVGLLLRQRF